METKEAIRARRAIKHYDANYKISEQEEHELLSLTMLSPTAFNIQNWRFVVVRDSDLRKEIRAAAWGQAQVTDASLLIILCADLRAWEKDPQRYWRNAPQETQDFILPSLKNYYCDNEQAQRDEAMRSCGIAAQTLMLTAKSMGFDSCPMDGFDFEKVGQLIHLPNDHVITMFVVIGKSITDAWSRPGSLLFDEVVIENSFKQP